MSDIKEGYGKRRHVRYIEIEYDAKSVGERISRYRKSLGLTRYELAAELGLSFDTLGRIERGERDARSEVLCILSEVFNVSVDTILKGDEEGSVSKELMELIKKTTLMQQQAVIDLAKAFHVGK